MAVERARAPERLEPPDAAQQLRAGEHPRRLAGERDQQVVLLRRELDRPVEHTHLAGADVDHDRARAQHQRSAADLRAPQHRSDSGAQLGVRERLLDDVVSPALEHPDPVKPARVARQHDQRRVGIDLPGDPLAGAHRVEQLERAAVDVDDDQLGSLDGQQRQRLSAIARDKGAVAICRQVVGVLWPDWLCARPRDRAAVHGGRQRRSGQVGHIRIRVTRAS